MNTTILKIFFILIFVFVAPIIYAAEDENIQTTDYFEIGNDCGVSIGDDKSGNITCKPWQKGSQTSYMGVSTGSCVCDYSCLPTPPDH
ncbi:MAG: hypothetical protein WCX69_05700, partial [Candidatus Paceibacterota bacterium]